MSQMKWHDHVLLDFEVGLLMVSLVSPSTIEANPPEIVASSAT